MTAAVAHQFDSTAQQTHAAKLGMWLFLASEVLFFGGMFAGYAVYRAVYADGFAAGSRQLDIWLGTLNTGVLLTSSFTVALAVGAIQAHRRRYAAWLLGITILLGAGFLAIKGFEYSHKYHEHLIPGPHFSYTVVGKDAPPPQGVELFFSYYFAMTGLHAAHMLIGMAVLAVLAFQLCQTGRAAPSPHRIEVAGLYWHFVDVVWVFLFPLLYLIEVTA